ncbi:MAG: hypothetical protein JW913_13610 [Chitinispirillaceae bacterium]|nr:hypothetical protein [Chitinispirillaceae bacterium]
MEIRSNAKRYPENSRLNRKKKKISISKTDAEGTVAYAVTVSGGGTSDIAPVSHDIVLDRPFVYFITYRRVERRVLEVVVR